MTPPPLETQTVRTVARNEMVDRTDRLRELVRRRNVADGMVVVYVPHTAAAVTVNENADPAVEHDLPLRLTRIVSMDPAGYDHAGM